MSRAASLKLGILCVVVSALPVLAVSSHATITFERTYGGSRGERALFVRETSDGGYILAGETSSFGAVQSDMYIIRTDERGDTVWTMVWGDAYSNSATSVEQTLDEGYVVPGYTFSGSYPIDIDVLRLGPLGGLLWSKKYTGGIMQANHTAEETGDGGYYVFGQSPDNKFHLIRMNSVGDSVWARSYQGEGWARGFCAKYTLDGGYILGGDTSPGSGTPNAYVVRTDSLGNSLWEMTYGGKDSEQALSVGLTSDRGYVFAMWSDSLGPNYLDANIIRTDWVGNIQWERWYGGAGKDVVLSVQQTLDGGYIMAGETESFGAGSGDVWLIKTDSFGSVLWMRTYGGYDRDVARSVEETSDGGYIIVGETQSFSPGDRAVYLIKTDQYGLVHPCDPVEPWEPRTQGYWRRQCKGNPHEDICAYVDSVHILANLFDSFDCDSVCDLLNVDPPENEMCRKARRQFMALLLNVASVRLAVCNCLEDGREVGDVISEIDSLLSGDPDFHTCVYAKTLADDINNGIGIVSCNTVWTQVPPKSVQPPSISVSPNPFSKSTMIEYEVKTPGPVRLEIYDKAGRLVRTLVNGEKSEGSYQIEWDGLNESGSEVPQGVYFSRLQAATSVTSDKLMLVR